MMSLFNQIYFSAFCSPMEIENPCSIGFFITEIQRNNIDFTIIIKTKPTAMTFRYDIANLCNICDFSIISSHHTPYSFFRREQIDMAISM